MLYLGAEGLGEGYSKKNANRFLLRMANLLIYIHKGGI